MLGRLRRRLAGLTNASLAALQAAAVAILTWCGAVLGVWLTTDNTVQFWILSGAGVAAVAILSFVARYVVLSINEISNRRSNVLAHAHQQLDTFVSEEQEVVEPGSTAVLVPAFPMGALRRLTQDFYDLLEAKYQESSIPGEYIAFETCLIAKSYCDDKLTICTWANRESRKPTSLSKRPQEPDIYDRTVAADLYREVPLKRPEPRLIEDTAAVQNYHYLYPTQRQRIRSTVVYPVLSISGELHGAFVATADKARFFQDADADYWYYLFDIYARRLALEQLRIKAGINRGTLAAPF